MFGSPLFLIISPSLVTLVLVSIEKIYQALKTVFDQIFKHLEARQKIILHYASYFQLSSLRVEKWSNAVFRVWYFTATVISLFANVMER